jgi:hypothetical protein
MPNEIKFWVISVTYGYNCTQEYGAWASKNPLDAGLISDEFLAQADESLWESYSYVVTGWDNEQIEGDTEEEREECLAQIREDFMCDISYDCEEVDPEEADQFEIIYDEREHD